LGSKEAHVRELLFPDYGRFFAAFNGIASRVTRAARLLEQGFTDPARWPELSASIQLVEHEADTAARDVDVGVDRMFIPPMDREDIHLLATGLERLIDIIGGTARRAVSLHATEQSAPAVALARILVRSADEIELAVSHIRDGKKVFEHCRAVKQREEEGDVVWEQAVSAMFNGHSDAIDVLRWKTLYDQLEDALDACEDVANELETITVKHM
jgi:uncharacterized protein Yka (UPF0111/DUF47 family)